MNTMTRPQRSLRQSAWVAVLFAIIGGVFGMHGLATHGTSASRIDQGTAGLSEVVPATVTQAHTSGVHAMTAVSTTLTAGVTAAMTAAGTAWGDAFEATQKHTAGIDTGHDPLGFTGAMCLAVLFTGALTLALLALLAAGRGNSGGFLLYPRGAPRLGAAGARDPDPPDLTWLCIRRC